MGADRQNIVWGFWLRTFFCPFRFLKLPKQRPIIKNSSLTRMLWFLFDSSRTKWFLFYSSSTKWYESTRFIIHFLWYSKSPGPVFCFMCSDIEHWDIYAYFPDAREDINSYNNVISKCMYLLISKKWKLLSFTTESAINETDFRLTPSKNFFAKSLKYCCFILTITKEPLPSEWIWTFQSLDGPNNWKQVKVS